MILFQVLFIAILLLEIGVGVAVKYNYKGLQDTLIEWFMSHNVEEYIKCEFPNKWISQMVCILIIFILSIV